MDYNFNIGVSFGGIRFDDCYERIVIKLGQQDKLSKEYFELSDGTIDLTICLEYIKFNIEIEIKFSDNIFEGNTFWPKNKILIDGINLYNINKDEILSILETKSNLDIKKTKDNSLFFTEINEEQYDFSDIGITLWFEDDILDDCCVYCPIDNPCDSF